MLCSRNEVGHAEACYPTEPSARFVVIFQSDLVGPFPVYPNHRQISCRLAPFEGRIAIVSDAERDAVDATRWAYYGMAGPTLASRRPPGAATLRKSCRASTNISVGRKWRNESERGLDFLVRA